MLFADLLTLLADQTQTAPDKPWFGDPLVMALPLILVFAYMFLLRPQMRQEQQRNSLTKNLKKDDEVLTTAGIYGSVVSVHDTKDEVTIKVSDNTRIRVTKATIFRNITQEEAAAKAEAAKKAGK